MFYFIELFLKTYDVGVEFGVGAALVGCTSHFFCPHRRNEASAAFVFVLITLRVKAVYFSVLRAAILAGFYVDIHSLLILPFCATRYKYRSGVIVIKPSFPPCYTQNNRNNSDCAISITKALLLMGTIFM